MVDRYDSSASRPLSVSANRWERGQRRRGEGSWSIRGPPRVAGRGGEPTSHARQARRAPWGELGNGPRIHGKPPARWSRDLSGAGGKRVERDGARSGSSSLPDTTSARGFPERN